MTRLRNNFFICLRIFVQIIGLTWKIRKVVLAVSLVLLHFRILIEKIITFINSFQIGIEQLTSVTFDFINKYFKWNIYMQIVCSYDCYLNRCPLLWYMGNLPYSMFAYPMQQIVQNIAFSTPYKIWPIVLLSSSYYFRPPVDCGWWRHNSNSKAVLQLIVRKLKNVVVMLIKRNRRQHYLML